MITAFFDTSENLVFFSLLSAFLWFLHWSKVFKSIIPASRFIRLHSFFVGCSSPDKKHVRLHGSSHGLFWMIFFKKISFLATMCNKDLIILIKSCTYSMCDGTRRHACSSPDKRWSAFPKNNKNSGVGTYFSIIHLKKIVSCCKFPFFLMFPADGSIAVTTAVPRGRRL